MLKKPSSRYPAKSDQKSSQEVELELPLTLRRILSGDLSKIPRKRLADVVELILNHKISCQSFS
jgi:hypothetical protein